MGVREGDGTSSLWFSVPSTFYYLTKPLVSVLPRQRAQARLLLTCASLRRPLPSETNLIPSWLWEEAEGGRGEGRGAGGYAPAKGKKGKARSAEEGQERAGGGSSSEASRRGNGDILKFHPWNTSSMFLPFHHITRTHTQGCRGMCSEQREIDRHTRLPFSASFFSGRSRGGKESFAGCSVFTK